MVRIRDVAWALAVAAAVLAGARPATANPISLTGNVASDFAPGNGSVQVPVDQGPGVIWGPSGSTPGTLPSGVFVQNIWLHYNAATDQMAVGIQGYKDPTTGQQQIFGDYSGNPNPASDIDTATNPDGTLNNFGGLKSVALTFAPLTQTASGQPLAGTPTIIAGIPQDKSLAGSGLDGFSVSSYSPNASGLEFSFGKSIANGGALAYNPSAAHPDLEFTISNFSKLTGINPSSSAYAIEVYSGMTGSANGITLGKVNTSWISPAPQTITGGSGGDHSTGTPEPTTWLAWSLMMGGAGWRYRRRLVARA